MASQSSSESDLAAIREGLEDINIGNVFSAEQVKDETVKMFPFLKDNKFSFHHAQDDVRESDI